MDFTELLKMGAGMIQNNSDSATTGLDTDNISNALSGLLSNSQGSFNVTSLLAGLASNEGVRDIVTSWMGSGENASISPSQITELLGSEKISTFASTLGLSEDSAQNALADALPQVIDKATSGDNEMLTDMLSQFGGAKGAMDSLGKMFG